MSEGLKLKIEDKLAIIEFDQPDAKVNILFSANLREFKNMIQEISKRQDIKGICIISNKPDIFIAGADIKEIEGITSLQDAEAKVREGQEILNALENLAVPTVALINGACLGGGLELALACDYRLASFSDKVKIGLPEIKLGILPGFGGTKRLSRLVGLRRGLEMILSAKPVSAQEALKIGLVDELVPQNRLLDEAKELLRRQKGSKRKYFKPRLKGFLNIFLDKTFLGRIILKNQSKRFILHTTRGHYPAPLKALEVVIKNYTSSLKVALEREAKAFAELAITSISKNLISVFYLTEKYKKARFGLEARPRPIHKCAVVGAGVMGGGIAQIFSFYGFPVRMRDLNYAALGRGLFSAAQVYNYAVKKKKIRPHQAILGLGRISTTLDYSGFSNADLVVEAVVEDSKVKKAVFNELSSMVRPDCILASNTSCLSIAEMSEGVRNKGRVVGMHFFNPVHRMPLIEIIPSSYTSDETVATVIEFSHSIGKTPIVVKDSCGFLVNRILIPYLNEAGFILEEGVGFEKIDGLMLRFGMPMGPFTLIDEIGLDVGFKVAGLLEAHFGLRMKVPEILKKVYEKKWLGKKTGKGFYLYRGKKRLPNKEIYSLTVQKNSTLCDDDILKRMVYKMINEAGRCLEEKICNEPSDVDIGMIMGIGFPAFRAGLLRYADSVGCVKIVEELKRFRDKTGSESFMPCNYLLDLAKRKEKFYK